MAAQSLSAEQIVDAPGHRTIELSAVDVEAVRLASIDRTVFVSGTLQPLRQSTLTAEVEGRVLLVDIRPGNKVEKGQVLAHLDSRDSQSRLAEQRARFASVQAQYELAERTLRRNEGLLARKFISVASLDNSRSSLDSNRENMKAQEALVGLAKQALDKSTIRSPLTGIVSERLIEPGQAVTPGARLFTLVDLSEMELVANVPIGEIGSIHAGQSIQLQVSGFGASVTGKVERIAPTADPLTRMIPIYIHIPNPGFELKGGMLVQGRIAIASSRPEPILRDEAIRLDGQQPYVLRIRDGVVERAVIETGIRDEVSGQVVVHKGLAVGDQVILARIASLEPGQRIVVRE
ncbi:MAG: efflux RND transporter periplasmic adaptor subunit [Thiobacillus sp.]|nr:efflux RND transporter periplasmic adaptor subunit [Thiobacillus sp.]